MSGGPTGSGHRLIVAGGVAAVLAAGAVPASAGTAKTALVSKTSAGEPASGGGSESAAISASGRYVAFRSLATNLPGNDAVPDVYVHDRKSGRTTLVSKTSTGDPAADGFSSNPSISASGRYVGFESNASNLPGGASVIHVYLHDRETGKTRLVSRTSAGDPAGGGDSRNPSISESGRYVAFQSAATNLPGGPDDDAFVHDHKTGKTRLISKTSAGETLDEFSGTPSISASGRYVAFDSDATNLPGNDMFTDVYVHDRETGKTKLVSKTSAGAFGDEASFRPSISASGRRVAFASSADNFPGTSSLQDIHVHDRKTGKTKLVSKTSAGEPAEGGESFGPSISASGRFVAFASTATNLPGDTTFTNVYVHDRKRGKTRLVSQTSGGDPATGAPSDETSISADGAFVAFDSGADNLPGDDTVANVYVRGPLR